MSRKKKVDDQDYRQVMMSDFHWRDEGPRIVGILNDDGSKFFIQFTASQWRAIVKQSEKDERHSGETQAKCAT